MKRFLLEWRYGCYNCKSYQIVDHFVLLCVEKSQNYFYYFSRCATKFGSREEAFCNFREMEYDDSEVILYNYNIDYHCGCDKCQHMKEKTRIMMSLVGE